MRKLLRIIGAWTNWLMARLVDGLIRIATFAVLAIISVVACVYVIDYSYKRAEQPCERRWDYSAVIEQKLWHSGEKENRLYLVKMTLTNKETGLVEGQFRAFVTPAQYKEMQNKVTLNMDEIHGNGWVISDWGVTIEDI